jgi:DNA-directed RNA polymerase
VETQSLDTQAQTRRRFEKPAPFSTTEVGRRVLGDWIPALGLYIAHDAPPPPRGLEAILRLSPEQLAFMALRALVNQIDAGFDPEAKNPARAFCQRLGGLLRDELEFAGLYAAKPYVLAAKNKHAALAPFRQIDWSPDEKVAAGDWLLRLTEAMDCFEVGPDGFPRFTIDHRAAIQEATVQLVYRNPLYMPHLTPPPAWTGWRTHYDDKISATFVRTSHPATIDAIQTALAAGSMHEHVDGVNGLQSVPWRINSRILPLVREFGGEVAARDVPVAEALLDKTFYVPLHCDFRGRIIPLPNFNFHREDPIRSLFLFARGKPVGDSAHWLEIAVANAWGVGGTWPERYKWVADNRPLIKAVAAEPRLIWTGKMKAEDRFAFAAACIEYVAADTDGKEYLTHLPVTLDASSNGLQHLALMMRDPDAATLVNLNSRDDDIRDVYGAVARRIVFNMTNEPDPLADRWQWHGIEVLRKILKRPIMTTPYGVTPRGMRDQVFEVFRELYPKSNDCPTLEEVAFLVEHIKRAAREMLRGPMKAMDYMRSVATSCNARGAFMEFTSPTGFPAGNRYNKSKTRRVELKFVGETATVAHAYTHEIKKDKALDSAAANLVHSLDAAHLIRVVNAAAQEGIVNVCTVHDCYGSLAPDVKPFQQIVRRELGLLHRCHDALVRLHIQHPGSPPPPKPGTLDPLTVCGQEYVTK